MSPTSSSRVLIILTLLTLSISAHAQFTPIGNLATSRMLQTATLLNSGKVLVIGGETGGFQGPALSSAELYDPATATFSSTGNMNTARILSTATLLNNGKVLIAFGFDSNWSGIASTELYDPASGTFAVSGSVSTALGFHSATLLGNGMVLVAGGEDSNLNALVSAEVFDPATGNFTATGSLNAGRAIHTATVLNNGKVLLAGGLDSSGNPIATAELYDPVAGTFASTGSLNIGRAVHTATLLNSGLVLIAGGYDINFDAVAAAELYDPSTGAFTLTGNMTSPRYDAAQGTLLNNGMVFFAGGQDFDGNALANAELYDPATGTFTVAGTMSTTRQSLTTTLLNSGQVLVAAGMDYDANVLKSAELFQPISLTPQGLVSIAVSPSSPSVSVSATQPFTAVGTFSGNSTQTLASVTWASSNGTVATIANDASNHGHAIALATGSSTVSACAGTVCGSTTMNVTATLVSITLAPASPSLTVGAGQQITATGTLSDGRTIDITASATWSSSNSSIVLIGTTPGFQGFAMGAASGTATITATLGSISANTPITVQNPATPLVPSITSVSPTTGAAGMQVSMSGSGFGTTQGTGSVWLGTTYGIVVSWSNTQIVAIVAAISTSGTAQVQQNGLSSNAVPFNVNTATISNISPVSGVAGIQVTISGAGFGADQGSGQVWLGTASGVVQSWSDTQVVAVVVTGATSGNAQILQNGVWSNAVPFAVNSLHVASVTPTSGGPGTSVTIAGTGFGSSQGNGAVWLGSTNGQVMSWSDTQVVAVVDAAAVTGVARIQQNGVWSNAETFTVPSSGSNALTIVPNLLNMVIGETKTVQALNASSQPVTGLTWTSSNPTVVSLSTDDPPILTALAVGRSTITAGTASADVTVFAGPLPVGTVIWSNPGDGSGVQSIVPAVPSATGVADVFAFQAGGTVQAITSSGATAWTANLNGAYYWQTVPDFQGGLVIANLENPSQQSIYKLDGITGQPYPAYNTATQSDTLRTPVVHTDGTIFTIDTNASAKTVSVIGINPTTGAQLFSVPLDQSTSTCSVSGDGYTEYYCAGVGVPNGSFSSQPPVLPGPPVIAGDGFFYVPYEYTTSQYVEQATLSYSINQTSDIALHLMLLRVGSDGSSSKIDVKDWTSSSEYSYSYPSPYTWVTQQQVQTVAVPNLTVSTPITNADQGALLTWKADTGGTCTAATYGDPTEAWVCNAQVPATSTYGLAATSGGQLTASATMAKLFVPVLQAQDGSFYGTDGAGNMVRLSQNGNVIWSVPNDYPTIATADGGVIGGSGVTYDNLGRATGQIGNVPTKGWLGDSYQTGTTSIQSVNRVPVNPATSLGAFLSGNPSGNGTAAQDVFRLGGPTLVKHTFDGTPLAKCIYYPLGPYLTYTFYGYEECASYTVLDHGTPAQPIRRAGIGFDEDFGRATQNGDFTVNQQTQNGSTLDLPRGILLDNLFWGFPANPIPAGYYYLQQQTITLHNTGAVVRVNCLDFEATDVTVTDVTNNPGAQCTR